MCVRIYLPTYKQRHNIFTYNRVHILMQDFKIVYKCPLVPLPPPSQVFERLPLPTDSPHILALILVNVPFEEVRLSYVTFPDGCHSDLHVKHHLSDQ